MEQIIKAIINGQSEVDTCDEMAIQIHKTGESQYHVLYNNKSLHVQVLRVDRNNKKVEFEIDQSRYEVTYKDIVDVTIEKMGLNTIVNKGPQDCMAPMPGLVLAVKVTPAQEVEEGTPLLILEAMKMENVIKADHAGVIKEILVVKGDTVEKGQLLITYA